MLRCSNSARTNASSPSRTHAALRSCGCAGSAISCSAHGFSHTAPSSIHRASNARSYCDSALVDGGICLLVPTRLIRRIISLDAACSGTTAIAPLLRDCIARSRVIKLSEPSSRTPPWQRKQFSERIGRTCESKSTAATRAIGTGPAMDVVPRNSSAIEMSSAKSAAP